MSKKKGEQILQIEIDTSEQYEQVISKEGLVVVDVYQEWCGHCKQFEPIFKKIRIDMSDPLLNFAIANADKIPELEMYRGKCEPCFLFFASRDLVAVVRGANAPVITKTISEQLAHEHKVLKGEAQRKPIVDTYIIQQQAEVAEMRAKSGRSQKKESKDAPESKPATICIIKPEVVEKKDEILAKIQEKGYSIIEQKEVTFTEEMAREFYAAQSEAEHFEELIAYMTSGPSIVLAISKDDAEDVVGKWRSDIGPTDLEEAKQNPDTLRAQFATDSLMNAVHGSDSAESASKELAFFFPKGLGGSHNGAERTIALIRPSALSQHKDEILAKIRESGFKIAMTRTIQLEAQDAQEFYAEHKDAPFFEDLVNEMTSGPLMVLCLVKEGAIDSWRSILGPKEKEALPEAEGTLRKEFDVAESKVNSLHGATTAEQAEKELKKFFPMQQTVAILKPGLTPEQKDEITKKIEESGFIIATKKSEKLTEEIAKEMYKNSADKDHYNDLVSLMTSGETDILVLSRENAIEGWRQEIGDVDPAKAKETNPDSLRALYGVDVLNNGIHGATNEEQAKHELSLFFGEAQFDETG